MEHIIEYNGWNTTSTIQGDPQVNYQYTSKDKIYYGVHTIYIIRDGKRIPVTAKFDTGARSSSIDLSIGEKLGIGNELLNAYRELEKIEVPRDISKKDLKKMEGDLTEEYSKKYPDISSVRASKSSSGFSVRPYIRLSLEFNGNYITTEANLRDRTGLSCEMLVGLGDML
jgi:hypothetical protein